MLWLKKKKKDVSEIVFESFRKGKSVRLQKSYRRRLSPCRASTYLGRLTFRPQTDRPFPLAAARRTKRAFVSLRFWGNGIYVGIYIQPIITRGDRFSFRLIGSFCPSEQMSRVAGISRWIECEVFCL